MLGLLIIDNHDNECVEAMNNRFRKAHCFFNATLCLKMSDELLMIHAHRTVCIGYIT